LKTKHILIKLIMIIFILISSKNPVVNAQSLILGHDIDLTRIWGSQCPCKK